MEVEIGDSVGSSICGSRNGLVDVDGVWQVWMGSGRCGWVLVGLLFDFAVVGFLICRGCGPCGWQWWSFCV